MRVFYASTLFGAMSLAAGIDDGLFGDGRRLLIVSNNAAIPEVALPLDETPGFAALRDRFDEVVSWNEIIAPLHPSDWKARIIEVPMMERFLRSALHLDQVEELVLESIAVPPARTVAGLVRDCPITVYSDGLMSYGPTRDPLPAEIHRRITRLLHLDLVPGLIPLLLSEYGVAAEILRAEPFLRVVESLPVPELPACDALILGQYLSSLGIVTMEEEAALHASMLRHLVTLGHTSVAFKPHPAAGRRHAQLLADSARELGAELVVVGESVPAEACFAALKPRLVAGCFSTGLLTAQRYFGLPVATLGTGLVLERLAPYENSNRIPVTIADALLPRLAAEEQRSVDVEALVGAVGYCMQPEALPGLRQVAEAFVAEHGTGRYFKKQRLGAVGLLPRAEQPSTLSRLRRRLARAIP